MQKIAVFNIDDGVSVLYKGDSLNNAVMQVTSFPGFPAITDTLLETKNTTYGSTGQNKEVIVNDSEVVITLFQKIIHPSSNWQGQTPWQETIVTSYPRADRIKR